jgi:hypothetical protein
MFVGTYFGLFMPGLRPNKPTDDPRDLQVRSRRAVDLDRLRELYLPELGETLALKGHDYQFRAYCTREQWGEALKRIALDIDYTKFKDSPVKSGFRDHKLSSVYMRIWSATLNALPDGSIYAPTKWSKHTSPTTVRTVTHTEVTEEIGERVRYSDLTPNQRRLLDDSIIRPGTSSHDRLWDEREPDVWELSEIENEHGWALWNHSEAERESRRSRDGHTDCDHVDTRAARKRCNRQRKAK